MIYEVGKTYSVPCVRVLVGKRPIILAISHTHRGDITGTWHRHLNHQFSSDFTMNLIGCERSLAMACSIKIPIKTHRRVCHHEYVPVENLHTVDSDEYDSDEIIKILEGKNKRKILDRCSMKCPHQGCDLSGLGNGKTVTCPCHGLKWSLKNGRLVRRS